MSFARSIDCFLFGFVQFDGVRLPEVRVFPISRLHIHADRVSCSYCPKPVILMECAGAAAGVTEVVFTFELVLLDRFFAAHPTFHVFNDHGTNSVQSRDGRQQVSY